MAVASTSPPTVSAASVKIAVNVYTTGGYADFNILTRFPLTVGFSVNNPVAGATYFWDFGDGTNSTEVAPIHSYATACVYPVEVKMDAPNGTKAAGVLYLGAFASKGTSGALAVCPPAGTAGLADVEVSGGFFTPHEAVSLFANGSSLGTVTADRGGDWAMNVTGAIHPSPNGTQYYFATTPSSLTGVFTSVEGVSASPVSGGVGTSVQVQGRSYPPDTNVTVYLGGVELGSAQSDRNGSFTQQFIIPSTSPFATAGTYDFSTQPPVLGSQAEFTSSGGVSVTTTSPPPPSTALPWWFWLLLVALVAVVAVLAITIAFLSRRRRKDEGQAQPPAPAETSKPVQNATADQDAK